MSLTDCAIRGCSHIAPGNRIPTYCKEHAGTGAIIEAIDNLAGHLTQLTDQIDRVERRLEGEHD